MPQGTPRKSAGPTYVANMTSGGTLGKYCSHAYAHANKEGAKELPAILKGSDMVAYEVFSSLVVATHVLPVLDKKREYGYNSGDKDMNHTRIGKKLSVPVKTDAGGFDECSTYEIYEDFPHTSCKVEWLNDRKKGLKNMQYEHLRVTIIRSSLFGLWLTTESTVR
jgi:hypothetical protein